MKKQTLNEQISRIKGMMKMVNESEFDISSKKNKIDPDSIDWDWESAERQANRHSHYEGSVYVYGTGEDGQHYVGEVGVVDGGMYQGQREWGLSDEPVYNIKIDDSWEPDDDQIMNYGNTEGGISYRSGLSEQDKNDDGPASITKRGGRIYFNNGSSISIKGGSGYYSQPREDGAVYTQLELGFPSEDMRLHKGFLKFQENPNEDPTQSVFGYVPIKVLNTLERMNGGYRSGQRLPMMWIEIGGKDENGNPNRDIWSGYVHN